MIKIKQPDHDPEGWQLVTDREVQILSLLAYGQGLKDIARLCKIKISTVDTVIRSIKYKLGVSKITALVTLAIVRGVVQVDEYTDEFTKFEFVEKRLKRRKMYPLRYGRSKQ